MMPAPPRKQMNFLFKGVVFIYLDSPDSAQSVIVATCSYVYMSSANTLLHVVTIKRRFMFRSVDRLSAVFFPALCIKPSKKTNVVEML